MIASRLLVPLASAAVLLAGCDEQPVAPALNGTREVVFDLRPLYLTADGGQPCVSVVESLTLQVEEENGDQRTYRRELTPSDAVVRIPIEVSPGAVTFTAEVRSNNETLLYEGDEEETIEAEGFQVEIPLEAVDAVLRACPDPVSLVYDDGIAFGDFEVINRGSGETTWEADYVDVPRCDGKPEPPCVSLDPEASALAADETIEVSVAAYGLLPGEVFNVGITSDVGDLLVRFVVEASAAAAPVPIPRLPTEAAPLTFAD